MSPAIFASVFIFLCTAVALDSDVPCTTPDGKNGTCLRIRNCPSFVSALQQNPPPQSTIELLRKSLCGITGSDPTVCCPSSNVTLKPLGLKAEGETAYARAQGNVGLLNLEICSNAYNSRVVKGMEVKLYELPQMNLLGYSVERVSPSECSGIIIRERFLTNAAHCVMKLQGRENRTNDERNYEIQRGANGPEEPTSQGAPVRGDTAQNSPPTRKNKPTVQEEILQILKTINEPQQLREVDADTSFLLSFTQNMRDMSPTQKIDFKIAVLNALKKIVYPSASSPTFDSSLNPVYPKLFASSFPRQSNFFP